MVRVSYGSMTNFVNSKLIGFESVFAKDVERLTQEALNILCGPLIIRARCCKPSLALIKKTHLRVGNKLIKLLHQ